MKLKQTAILTILLSTLLWSAAATAEATEVGGGRNFGLGVAIGGPTSIAGKYYLSPNHALDFGLAFWRWGDRCSDRDRWDRRYCDGFRHLGLNADFLWQDTLAQGSAKLDWHIGAGARLWLRDDYYDDDFALAARMPIGLDLTFARPSFVEAFLELAPALYIVPGVDLRFEGFIGVRFYF